MSKRPVGLRDWTVALRDVDECPYVGPRPQSAERDGASVLVGRAEDLERISRAVLKRSLVVLDGYSGVGKSSLLQNGLFARLRDTGFAVIVCRRWGLPPAGFDGSDLAVERYIVDCARLTHEDPRAPIAPPDGLTMGALLDSDGLCQRLDDLYRDSGAVLILDQFEELLRQSGGVGASVVKWVINIGYRYRTRVVLSLRTDSLHYLDPLLRGVRPFTMDRVNVGDVVDPDSIAQVIGTPRAACNGSGGGISAANRVDPSAGQLISQGAAGQLLALWMKHQPKLLELQATLYAIYFRAREARLAGESASSRNPVSVRIESEDVRALCDDARSSQRTDGDPNPFSFGIHESIRLKVEHAEWAARRTGLDEYLVCGAREIVRMAAPFLSSGGFKVPIHESELAGRALSRELRVLESALLGEWRIEGDQRTSAKVGEIFRSVFENLTRPGKGGDILKSNPGEVLARDGRCIVVRDHDRAGTKSGGQIGVTAGPMMGSTASATLVEEARRAAFAIEWLEATEIVRRDPDGTVLLIHDGSGKALNAWVAAQRDMPEYAIRQLTASRGEHFVWVGQSIGGDDFRVIPNLNWRECRISVAFRNVVFVNCNFTALRFDGCSFEGVTFVNCILDDANFESCVFKGSAHLTRILRDDPEGKRRAERSRLAPSFTVEAPEDQIREFLPYMDSDNGSSSHFFSDTSNTPAMPCATPVGWQGDLVAHFITAGKVPSALNPAAEPSASELPRMAPAAGGVGMVGGRVCFLTLYGCKSEGGGSFALHHVSGGGVDLVEQQGGGVEVYGAAIRGISVSRDEESALPATGIGEAARIELSVADSIVTNLYFSKRLKGWARVRKSVVLMLINCSENVESGFRVHLDDCRYQFLVNACDPSASSEDSMLPLDRRYFSSVAGSESRFSATNREALASDLAKMDYRARPEVSEAIQRDRRARSGRH